MVFAWIITPGQTHSDAPAGLFLTLCFHTSADRHGERSEGGRETPDKSGRKGRVAA